MIRYTLIAAGMAAVAGAPGIQPASFIKYRHPQRLRRMTSMA
ncbi:MAG: hypothetical protein ACRESS_04600 [Stenotrophobium sp.]